MDNRVTANALRRELTKAGLQGCLSAEAFQALLQYVLEVQGSREVLNSVLEILRQGVFGAASRSGHQAWPFSGLGMQAARIPSMAAHATYDAAPSAVNAPCPSPPLP